jgi:hypothetical protein
VRNASLDLKKVNLYHNTRNKYGPSEAWFLIYGFRKIKDNALRVNLKFPCRNFRIQTSGTVLSSTTCSWGFLPQFPARTVARYGSAYKD